MANENHLLTEQLRRDLRLAKSELKKLKSKVTEYNRITDLMQDLILVCNEEGEILSTFHNLESHDYREFDLKQGVNFTGLIHPDDKVVFRNFIERSVVEINNSIILRIRRRNEEYSFFDIRGKFYPDEHCMYLNLRDLSNRMDLRKSPEAINQSIKNIFKRFPFVIFRYDHNLRHIYVSPNISESLPYESHEILGTNFNELEFSRTRKEYFTSVLKGVFDTGRMTEEIFELNTQKGGRLFRWQLIPEYENNRIVTVLALLEDITEQSKIQKKDNGSEEKFRKIFVTIPDAVVLSRMEDGLLYEVNQGFLDLMGYSSEEVLNKTSLEINLHKDQEARNDFISHLKQTPVVNKEITLFNKEGREIEVLISSSLLILEGETCLLSVFRDVTSIKQNEKMLTRTVSQLRETEKKFSAFIEQSPDGISLTDEEGKIRNWNISMEKFTGISKDEIFGKSWEEVQALIDKIRLSEKVENAYMQDKVNELRKNDESEKSHTKFQVSLNPESDHVYHLDNYLFTVKGERGCSMGIICRDMTREKRNQEGALLYEKIFEHHGDGIAILYPDGSYKQINKAYTAIVGYTSEELKGRDCSIIIGNKTLEGAMKVFEYQGIFKGELKAVKKNGKEIYIENQLFPVISEDRTLYLVHIIKDISLRKKNETGLINARQKAEEADRLKIAFLSNMSHEIRTPMNSILGFASLLKNPRLSHDQGRKYLDYIHKNGESLLNLIGDIVDIAKIESNQLTLQKGACNVTELLQEIKSSMETVKEMEGKESVELKVVTSSGKDLYIFTDEYRLRQVLINIVHNAIKFTFEGSIEFGYEIKNSREIVFHVKDTGVGIPVEKQEAIFKRFQKLENSRQKLYSGAGLGLAISNELINILGGSIWLESYVGIGSSFFFSLPFVDISDSQENLEKEASLPDKLDWKGKKILIVEDNLYNTELLNEFFDSTGATLLYAQTGKQAVNIFTDNPDIDLIIMDIKLPEMSGIEATQLIREIQPDIPVIALTAFAMSEELNQLNSGEFSEFLVKPVQKTEFLLLVKKHLIKNT